ncbi:MAG TPA: substrate-binding domain-containing protein [bacterium]|nr:substrate-binding domain-containing protein [bacterium]
MKVAILSLLNGKQSRYWKFIEQGIEAACGQFQAEALRLSPPFEGANEKQISAWQVKAIDEILKDKEVKAAGVAWQDGRTAAASLNKLADAGIPFVTFDSDAPDSKRAFFIGANNPAMGRTCAYVLAKQVSFSGGIAIDSPSLIIQSCIDRITGFKDAICRYRDIRIIAEVGGDDSLSAMQATAKKTLDADGLKGVFCVSSGSAKIYAELLKQRNMAGKVALVCVNADEQIMEHIKNGVIHMAVAQRPYSIGYRLMDYLYQIARSGIDTVLRGIPTSKMADTGMHQVTKSNLDSYRETLRKTETA